MVNPLRRNGFNEVRVARRRQTALVAWYARKYIAHCGSGSFSATHQFLANVHVTGVVAGNAIIPMSVAGKVGADLLVGFLGRKDEGNNLVVSSQILRRYLVLCVFVGGLAGPALASFRGATGAATGESETGRNGARNSQTRTQGLQREGYETNPKQPQGAKALRARLVRGIQISPNAVDMTITYVHGKDVEQDSSDDVQNPTAVPETIGDAAGRFE
ncbi:hypothetical protein B0H12DRAFT_1309814 [Mycena haematopus]|nr:hypothetical protein B0H12DRAFT_1309814 [Mycena haematopus]